MMNNRNGRSAASMVTEIKHYVVEAQRLTHDSQPVRNAGVNIKEVTIPTGYGEVVVKLVAHSPYQDSHYQIVHPLWGKWMGYLNSISSRAGEFGVNPGKPNRMS